MASAVGVAIYGAIANATLLARLSDAPPSVAEHLGRTTDATSLVLGGHLDPASPVVRFVRTALYDASSTYSSLWRSSRSS
jgi:hypothetical protein